MDDSLTFTGFTEKLASASPTPGGGGASAAVGALACSLGLMLANLTSGKERYKDVQPQVDELLEKLEALRLRMLALVDEDAAAFEPLSRAYGIPKDDPTRVHVMEEALTAACEPPLAIMQAAADAIDCIAQMVAIGSRIAVSDGAAAAVCARAALEAASLNIYINAASLADRAHAQELTAQVDALLSEYTPRAQDVFTGVVAELGE